MTITTLCDACAVKARRDAVALCIECAKNFRVIYLPSDVRMWSEITRDAYSEEGTDVEELMDGLLVKIFNQQRELAKQNQRISDLRRRIDGWFEGIAQALGRSRVSDDRLDGSAIEDQFLFTDALKVMRRYMWMRDCRRIVWDSEAIQAVEAGGERLDKLCDDGVREHCGVST